MASMAGFGRRDYDTWDSGAAYRAEPSTVAGSVVGWPGGGFRVRDHDRQRPIDLLRSREARFEEDHCRPTGTDGHGDGGNGRDEQAPQVHHRLGWWDRIAVRIMAWRGEDPAANYMNDPIIIRAVGPHNAKRYGDESLNSVLEDHIVPMRENRG